jgi:hypothetical protein
MLSTVTLLGIDLGLAAPPLREALTLSAAELDELVSRARASEGASDLVILADEHRIEIYATEASRPTVLRAVLPLLVTRAGGRARLAELSVIEAEGPTAARHLLRAACGVGSAQGQKVLTELAVAVERSRRAGALGKELSVLFTRAIRAGYRAEFEALAGDPTRSDIDPELTGLEIERIVEEELVGWRRACLMAIESERALAEREQAASEQHTFVRRKAPSLRGARLA